MKKLIAKTIKGKEFLHSKENAFFTNNNDKKVLDILNKTGYKINNSNEVWHSYDYDFSQDYYVDKKIFMYNGKLTISTL